MLWPILLTDLEWGPALAAIVALEALKELWVIALMRVHMETQIFLSEEARAADPAVVRSQEWFERFIVPTGRRKISNKLVVKVMWYYLQDFILIIWHLLSINILLILLAEKMFGGSAALPLEELFLWLSVGWRIFVLRVWLANCCLSCFSIGHRSRTIV